jgi:hypothetical protein
MHHHIAGWLVKTKGRVIVKGIDDDKDQWNSIQPDEKWNVLIFPEDDNSNEVKWNNKPKPGKKELNRHQGYFTGKNGYKDPNQIQKDSNSDRVIQYLFVIAAIIKKSDKEYEKHPKHEWLCGQ